VPLPSATSLFLLSNASVISTSGGVVSCTAIENDSSAELPAASSALHVTIVSPMENVSPEYSVN
jgi:hypothetical protein